MFVQCYIIDVYDITSYRTLTDSTINLHKHNKKIC